MFTALIRKLTGNDPPVQAAFSDESVDDIQVDVQGEVPGEEEQHAREKAIDRDFFSLLIAIPCDQDAQLSRSEKALLSAIEREFLGDRNLDDYLPRLPRVIPRVMLALRDEAVDVANLAELLSSDVVLAGGLIRLSNSAYFSRGRELGSLDEAIVSIGFDGLRQMLVSMMTKPILSGQNKASACMQLWDISMSVSQKSGVIARKLHVNPFHAYIITMLAQSGAAILAQHIRQHHEAAVVSPAFIDRITALSIRLSADIASSWGFPDEVSAARLTCLEDIEPASMPPLSQIACLADKMIRVGMLNAAMPGDDGERYEMLDCECEIGSLLASQ